MEIQEPIDQKKKLNIIAIADDSEYGVSAWRYGKKLAEVFDATLTVITRFGFQMTEKGCQPRKYPIDCADVRDDYFFPETLFLFAEKRNTIMFVIGVDPKENIGFFNKKSAQRFIKPSRLPVLTVGKKVPDNHAFQHVMLPIDIERQAKEKALWAGYFSRFYGSSIHILHPEYKDSGLSKQVTDNIDFVEKLYGNLEINYTIHNVGKTKNIDLFSLEYAEQIGASLTVINMTKYYTIADLIAGPREKKIIGNAQEFPVLCINQRDDLYILCT